MVDFSKVRASMFSGALVVICTALLAFCASSAGAQPSQDNGDPAGVSAFELKTPLIGGACPACPWGALATIVRTTMNSEVWYVQQCYTCWGENSVRIISEARRPPHGPPFNERELPASPAAPVDFGVTSMATLTDGYHGRAPYDHAYGNLRVLARIEHPNYLMVSVRRDSMITDQGQIKDRKLPVKILTDGRDISDQVLRYYGIDADKLASWGGSTAGRDDRDDFDVIIFRGYLGNSPESNIWYEVSQRMNLRFLELSEDLLAQLVEDHPELQRGTLPIGYLRGVDRAIPTVVRSGQVIYGRNAMPDDVAYTIAKTLDEHRDAFIWSHLAFSYDPKMQADTLGVPLHPGAARYYREQGYIR